MKHPNTVAGAIRFVVDNQAIVHYPTEATVATENAIHLIQLVKDSKQLVMTSQNLITTDQTTTSYPVDVWQAEAIINILQGIQKINNGIEALRQAEGWALLATP